MEPKLRPLPETPAVSRDISPDLVLARMHLAEGNHDAAKRLLQAHLNAHPDDKEALRQFSSLRSRKGKGKSSVWSDIFDTISLILDVIFLFGRAH